MTDRARPDTYTLTLYGDERAQLVELTRLLGSASVRSALMELVGRELDRLRAAEAVPEHTATDVAQVAAELRHLVARLWSVHEPSLASESRLRQIAWARQNWYLLLRERLPHVGIEALGLAVGRNHSTVLHGIGQAQRRAATITSEAQRLARARLLLGL